MNGAAKRITKLLKKHGATCKSETSTAAVWELPNGDTWKVFDNISDHAARTVEKNLARALNVNDGRGKRSGETVKDRQAKEREHAQAELERVEAERAVILERREKYYRGLTAEEKRREDAALEKAEAEFRKWQSFMQSLPLPNSARHRS